MPHYRFHTLTCCSLLVLLLAAGNPLPLRADSPAERIPPAAPTAASDTPTASPADNNTPPLLAAQTGRRPHLAPRGRSQHTVFANAGATSILSTIYLAESSSGSLNKGWGLSVGYNWTSPRGLGVGVLYSGDFIEAERDGIERASRLHYIAPEFVARQRAGRRWLFRESAGIGYGRYVRRYGTLSGSRGGVGIHETVAVECMLTRRLGLSAGFSGQWLIVDSPDVDDGAELNLVGILRFRFGGGLRIYL